MHLPLIVLRFHDSAAVGRAAPHCGCSRGGRVWAVSTGRTPPSIAPSPHAPHFPPSLAQKSPPLSSPQLSAWPLCLSRPPSAPEPPILLSLHTCSPHSCFQCDSGLFVGFPFPKSHQQSWDLGVGCPSSLAQLDPCNSHVKMRYIGGTELYCLLWTHPNPPESAL